MTKEGPRLLVIGPWSLDIGLWSLVTAIARIDIACPFAYIGTTMKNFNELIERVVQSGKKRRVSVAAANELSVLEAVAEVHKKGWADFHLVGPRDQIEQIAANNHIDLSGLTIQSQPDDLKSAVRAVELVRSGEADLLMKGYIHTDDFLRAVLDKERGLRRPGVIMRARDGAWRDKKARRRARAQSREKGSSHGK